MEDLTAMLQVKKEEKKKKHILHNWLQYHLIRKGERRRGRKVGGLVMVSSMWLSWSHYNKQSHQVLRYDSNTTKQRPILSHMAGRNVDFYFLHVCSCNIQLLSFSAFIVWYSSVWSALGVLEGKHCRIVEFCRFLLALYYTGEREWLSGRATDS